MAAQLGVGKCLLCKRDVDPTRRFRLSKARYLMYSCESGWTEVRLICGACLDTKWKSMVASYESGLAPFKDIAHGEWKTQIYRDAARALVQEWGQTIEVLPENWELKGHIHDTESDDDWPGPDLETVANPAEEEMEVDELA